MSAIAIIAFSFALRAEELEPNPCNINLGDEMARIIDSENIAEGDEIVIIAQWEVARRLRALGFQPDLIVGLHEDGSYLTTKDVWDAAKPVLKQYGIREIIPVAQPFLHLPVIKKMIRNDGYTILNRKIRWIGFDNSPLNTQPWTRSAIRFITYAVRQKLGALPGHQGKQSAS